MARDNDAAREKAANTFDGMADPADAGVEYTINSPIWAHGHDKVPPGAIPAIGQHTEEILREFGLVEEDVT